jgi:hypothetical protein
MQFRDSTCGNYVLSHVAGIVADGDGSGPHGKAGQVGEATENGADGEPVPNGATPWVR